MTRRLAGAIKGDEPCGSVQVESIEARISEGSCLVKRVSKLALLLDSSLMVWKVILLRHRTKSKAASTRCRVSKSLDLTRMGVRLKIARRQREVGWNANLGADVWSRRDCPGRGYIPDPLRAYPQP